jgi:hypothetical protein
MVLTAYAAMLEIDRTARAGVAATPARCRERLVDIDGYPRWSSLIRSATREGERVHIRAELLGIGFEMACELEAGDQRVVLRRLPNDDADEERFDATWTLLPGEVSLHVKAALEAPGPARLIRGRVERRLTDDLLADFTRSL